MSFRVNQPIGPIAKAALGFALLTQSALGAPGTKPSMADDCLAAISVPLQNSKGNLTPELRRAYVDWCWSTIQHDLQEKQRGVSGDCVAEVEKDQELKDAACASVYPPDPSILQNYATLRTLLGPAFTQKYRSLAIAISVARRIGGVELDRGPDIGRENQVPNWVYRPIRGPGGAAESRCIEQMAAFMRSEGCSALDLFNSQDLRARLAKVLASSGVDKRMVDGVARTPEFGERLKNAMIVLHQRPAGRTARPTCIDWLKHFVAIYESKPSSTPSDGGRPMPWPLFPVSGTPWPLLMPLSHPAPLDEADYLWEAFQGEHGSDRYHTYGPYRDDLTSMPDMLVPSKWFWNAVPDQIVHGGECMPISLATWDLYASLGKPAMDACQPGHANLISFQNDGGTWKADIEQDFAGGARVTQSQWFFGDPSRHELHFQGVFGWPGAEYHLGLAVGMNFGLSTYIDTRIACRIFDLLSTVDQGTIGLKLLKGAALENPFNPEVWYRIAGVTTDVKDGLMLVKELRNHDPKALVDGRACTQLQTFFSSGRAGPAGGDMDNYWSVLAEFVARSAILERNAPGDEPSMRDAYVLLKTVPGLNASELADFTRKFSNYKSASAEAEGVKYDQALADKHDPFGCLRMGQRFLDGEGVPRDDASARRYLTFAALQGESSAAQDLNSLVTELPIEGVELTASSTYSPTQNVSHLIDGAGMSQGLHDNNGPAATMWQTVDNPAATAPALGLPLSPAWVRFDFPKPKAFDAVEIWNHNQANLTDRGFRRFQIYGTSDGKTWSPLTKDAELPRAPGTMPVPPTLVPTNSGGRLLKSVIIAAAPTDGNFGSADFGLSAVRFVILPQTRQIPSYEVQVETSSQFSDTQASANLVNGNGMTGQFHDNNNIAATMWQTPENPKPTQPTAGLYRSKAWVRFDFSSPRYLESIEIWNHNQANLTDRGFKKMRIYGTSDGIEWFVMTSTEDVRLPRASGAALIAGTTFFNAASERPVRAVLLIADPNEGNYGSICYGLSAVRFTVAPPKQDPLSPVVRPGRGGRG